MRVDRHNLTNLNALIRLEVDRAVESILESRLSPGDDEKHRQSQVAKAVDDRNLRASDNKEVVDEAESDEQDENPSAKEPEKAEKRKDRTGGKGTADSKKAETPNIQDLRKPSLTNFVDKLNIVRGGKSLKDPNVKKSFETYLGTLNVKEKQTMLVFLTAISQILVGKKQGAEALDPGEVGLRIKASAPPKVPVSKNTTGSSNSAAGTEQTPIVVGESQDKAKLKKVIEAYRGWK